MKFRMVHNNFNVLDLEKSLKFYADAFDMKEVRRINAKDGSFIIVYLEDGNSTHQLAFSDFFRSGNIFPFDLFILSWDRIRPTLVCKPHPAFKLFRLGLGKSHIDKG